MRGKVSGELLDINQYGITPAYAGKSAVSLCCGCLWWDHPRLCGEKLSDFSIIANVLGSPPPMRGKVDKGSIFAKSLRITPAYAGKSPEYHTAFQAVRDHPRLCGEKISNSRSLIFCAGSPPPMRGKASDGTAVAGGTGITPAYAGKSASQKD